MLPICKHVCNLLMQRKKLQSFYRDSLMHINISTGQEEVPVATDMPSAEEDVSETPPTTLEMSPNDRKFMDKLIELMEQNMDNGELVENDVGNWLSAVLSSSRS